MIKKMERKNLISLTAIIILAVLCFVLSINLSSAYFKYKKVYEGSGELPILNIDYKINSVSGKAEPLKNIVYLGQNREEISVLLNTQGNNINGKVRVKVGIVWSNSLNNTPLNDLSEQVTACKLNVDVSKWEFKDNCYYLKEDLKPNSEIALFEGLLFDPNLSEYLGNSVSVYLIVEIYQSTNLPEDWR